MSRMEPCPWHSVPSQLLCPPEEAPARAQTSRCPEPPQRQAVFSVAQAPYSHRRSGTGPAPQLCGPRSLQPVCLSSLNADLRSTEGQPGWGHALSLPAPGAGQAGEWTISDGTAHADSSMMDKGTKKVCLEGHIHPGACGRGQWAGMFHQPAGTSMDPSPSWSGRWAGTAGSQAACWWVRHQGVSKEPLPLCMSPHVSVGVAREAQGSGSVPSQRRTRSMARKQGGGVGRYRAAQWGHQVSSCSHRALLGPAGPQWGGGDSDPSRQIWEAAFTLAARGFTCSWPFAPSVPCA